MQALERPGGRCPHCGHDNASTAKAQQAHALPCGFLLHGRYVIGKMLGQGGFGVTYIGWDLALELRVCVKEYFPAGAAMRNAAQYTSVSWSGGESAEELKRGRESFIKEARKAVKLRKLNAVVQVWDVFYENDTAYLVMDYIDGVTLKSHLLETRRPLTEEACVRLLMPVIRDLEEVHARGIIHRDISPDNLMLQPDGTLVLLDIGAAKDLNSGNGQSSVLVAKKGFSPLEQYASGGNIGPWTDVYAMCATIFYCVTGRLPPPPIDRLTGEEVNLGCFSPAFAKVLEKGLAIRTEDRIQSMAELAEELQKAISGPRPAPQPKPAPKPAPVPKPQPQQTVRSTEETNPEPKREAGLKEQRTDGAESRQGAVKKKRGIMAGVGIAALLAVLCAVLYWFTSKPADSGNVQQIEVVKPVMLAEMKAVHPEETLHARGGAAYVQCVSKWQQEIDLGVWSAAPLKVSRKYDKIYDCSEISIDYCLNEYSGNLLGDWILYLKDAYGNWEPGAKIYVSEAGVGSYQTYNIRFNEKKTFSAICIVPSSGYGTYNHSMTVFVPAEAAENKGRRACSGHWEEARGPQKKDESVFLLDKAIEDCRELAASIEVTSYTGDPFGSLYLYGRDPEGNWTRISAFPIRQEEVADGAHSIYTFALDKAYSFDAFALQTTKSFTKSNVVWNITFLVSN